MVHIILLFYPNSTFLKYKTSPVISLLEPIDVTRARVCCASIPIVTSSNSIGINVSFFALVLGDV